MPEEVGMTRQAVNGRAAKKKTSRRKGVGIVGLREKAAKSGRRNRSEPGLPPLYPLVGLDWRLGRGHGMLLASNLGRVMRKLLILCGFLFATPGLAQECTGQNLIEALSPDRRAALEQAVAPVPYNKGIFWEARKGQDRIVLIGTYHFGDPRHDQTITHFADQLDGATVMLVEAGPDEQTRLTEALTKDPTLIADPTGPTLPERMEKADWDQLSRAMADRGIPAFVASRMRPWYVAMMLGMSPCMLEQVKVSGKANGLDQLLMDRAVAQGIPVEALEPWDTVFSLFADMTPAQEIEMLRSTMPAAEHADDYGRTLIDAYFSGDVWEIWEFGRLDAYENSGLSRAAVDEQTRLAQEKMMDGRNQSWIKALDLAAEQAAKSQGYVVAAFGALHLPGEQGVLRLLERDGWTVTALPSPHH